MKTLSIQDQRSIEHFFQLPQETLLKVMKKYLEKKYENVISTGDFIIAVGDIPIALVAHLDTVFSVPPTDIYYDRNKNVMWSPQGLGADDRAGVFAIAQIVKKGYKPTVILTTDEEIGGVGAAKMVSAFPNSPTDLKYIIELDRQGSNDCVFYSCDNPDFEEYVENFNFVTNFGSFSDISIICPAWKIAGVNLSIGYYNEHSKIETLNIGQMFNTIKQVQKMLDSAETANHFEYKELKYNFSYFNTDNLLDDWDPSFGISKNEWAKFMNPQIKCNKCGEYDFDYNLFPVLFSNHDIKMYCVDCLNNSPNIYWCEKCGTPYYDNRKDNKKRICYGCRE